MKAILRATLAAGLILATGAAVQADTLTLFAAADTGYGSASNSPDNYGNNGLYGYMNADNFQNVLYGGTRHFLAQWDLSGIPAGSTVTSAQVNVFGYDQNTTGVPFSVYRVTSAWTEGLGMSNGLRVLDMKPAGSGANWYYRQMEGLDGIPVGAPGDSDLPIAWTTPGGDIDAASRVQFTGTLVNDPFTGATIGMQPDVTAIAQSWVNGDNFGLVIMSDELTYIRHAMRTREFGYPDNGQPKPVPGAYAPQLVITYTAGATWHPGDANKDGVVDLQDFGMLKDHFGVTTGGIWDTGDFNGDGAIDLQDFGILKDHFGHTTGDTSLVSVPEPATVLLLAALGAALRRRRQ